MKLAIMQPYFLPYIGYFQLMNAVDEFIIYDNIEFTKKGWIHRNRILSNGKDAFITLSLKKDSDFLDIRERCLSDSWPTDRIKMLNRVKEAYRKAPFYHDVMPLVEEIILYDKFNLFEFIIHSLEEIRAFLKIQTPIIISSTIPIDHSLRSEAKVIALCKNRGATDYVNPIGGVELYSKSNFLKEGMQLHFLKTTESSYPQFGNPFVPWLSILDVMMFRSKEEIAKMLNVFQLL